MQHNDGRGNSHCNLASLDEDERAAAVGYAITSIRWAAELGARRLVVHLGAVTDEPGMFEEELRMRRLFDGGSAASPEFAEWRGRLLQRRKDLAAPHLEAARESLRALVAAARPNGITIGIENRYHYHEIPHPEEYEVVLDGLQPDEAGYWHDVGHAEVLHRLGLIDRHAWLGNLGKRLVGAHLHDVEGIGDHRTPGDGDVEWGYLAAGLGHLTGFTLEINQHQPVDLVAGAPAFLESVGIR